MPNYDPADADNGLPDGEYDLTVRKVSNGQSKSGNEMQTVTFSATDGRREVTIKEYFTFGPKALWRYRALAVALGQHEAFTAKTFDAANFVGQSVRARLGYDPEYRNNKVSEYLERDGAPAVASAALPKHQPATPSGESINEDDIPF